MQCTRGWSGASWLASAARAWAPIKVPKCTANAWYQLTRMRYMCENVHSSTSRHYYEKSRVHAWENNWSDQFDSSHFLVILLFPSWNTCTLILSAAPRNPNFLLSYLQSHRVRRNSVYHALSTESSFFKDADITPLTAKDTTTFLCKSYVSTTTYSLVTFSRDGGLKLGTF